jgi:hypothetical protein
VEEEERRRQVLFAINNTEEERGFICLMSGGSRIGGERVERS